MRAPVLTLVLCLAALGGCPSTFGEDRLAADEDGGGNGSGAGSGSGGAGQGLAPNCSIDAHCVAAGPKCCDCPTHAVPASDPTYLACSDVDCAPAQCGSPMQAACNGGYCVLECSPVACDDTQTAAAGPYGFAVDANGCLTCDPAGTADVGGECTADMDCARVQDDCCGCMNGGEDTSVPTSQVAQHNAALNCPSSPVCPGGNTCAPDLAPRCVQGACELVSGALPPNACGRADLPPCPTGEACYLNADDQATMHGVGVCQP